MLPRRSDTLPGSRRSRARREPPRTCSANSVSTQPFVEVAVIDGGGVCAEGFVSLELQHALSVALEQRKVLSSFADKLSNQLHAARCRFRCSAHRIQLSRRCVVPCVVWTSITLQSFICCFCSTVLLLVRAAVVAVAVAAVAAARCVRRPRAHAVRGGAHHHQHRPEGDCSAAVGILTQCRLLQPCRCTDRRGSVGVAARDSAEA